MGYNIRFRTGKKELLPNDALLGQPLFCTDTKELYIGMGENQPLHKVGIVNPDDMGRINDYYDMIFQRNYRDKRR